METTLTLGKVYINSTQGRMWPPNLNARMHWTKRSQWNREFKRQVWGLVMEQRKKFGKIPYTKANVTITYYTCRPMDIDNFYSSAKPLVDGLTQAGVIVDDNQDCINFKVEHQKVFTLKEQKTIIKITPL